MKFSVEIDGEIIIQHQIESQAEKRSYFSQERKLTKDIINKMNEFHSDRWIDLTLNKWLTYSSRKFIAMQF